MAETPSPEPKLRRFGRRIEDSINRFIPSNKCGRVALFAAIVCLAVLMVLPVLLRVFKSGFWKPIWEESTRAAIEQACEPLSLLMAAIAAFGAVIWGGRKGLMQLIKASAATAGMVFAALVVIFSWFFFFEIPTKPAPPEPPITKSSTLLLADQIHNLSRYWDNTKLPRYYSVMAEANRRFKERTDEVYSYLDKRGEASEELTERWTGALSGEGRHFWASNQMSEIADEFEKAAAKLK